jgi:hypothetical protein
MTDELIKGMPLDEMTQAMVPAYQKHFTAMRAVIDERSRDSKSQVG